MINFSSFVFSFFVVCLFTVVFIVSLAYCVCLLLDCCLVGVIFGYCLLCVGFVFDSLLWFLYVGCSDSLV